MKKRYPAYDYGIAAAMALGAFLFASSMEEALFAAGQGAFGFTTNTPRTAAPATVMDSPQVGEDEGAAFQWMGPLLLGLYLVFASFTNQYEAQVCRISQPD